MDFRIFGCKTNRYFAEKWLVHPHLAWKEGYFIASCVVTDKAKAKWVKHALKKLPILWENEKLYLSGCGNIRDGVVDPRFYEVYDELARWKDRIEILPEDPDDWWTPFVKGGRGDFTRKSPIPYKEDLKEKAKELRNNMTNPEKNIWYKLLSKDALAGLRFVRQKPLLDYIVDFYCDELWLVIEIDGESHIWNEQYDIDRTKELEQYGLKILRFTNYDALNNLAGIRETILAGMWSQKSSVASRQLLYKGAWKIRSLKKLWWKQIFTRKFLVVQTGCDNFCTFCLTVQARWRHKWRPMEEIIEEVNIFVESGGKEVVLTGINLGAWWAPSSNQHQESKFVGLVEALLEQTLIERIRISSLGVEFCTDELIDLFAHPRIIAYPHLSIQSGSTHILEKMGRHYDGEFLRSVLSKLQKIQRTDGVQLNIGADIIVGFPWETDEYFAQTLELIERYGVTKLHAFPFSPHVDHYSVPAGKFPHQVPNHITQHRLKLLLQKGNEAQRQLAEEHMGKELRVLIEKHTWEHFSGWSENYLYCDKTNFTPFPWQKIARGEVARWIYERYIDRNESE